MDEFSSFAGAVALWLAVSISLWLLHRRSVNARQQRQTQQAARAVSHIAKAQAVFDAIRAGGPAQDSSEAQTAATYALLKRIQDHGGFFDKVTALRIEMLAAFAAEDHPPLSEILQIRRDLWAASEILLVEDPASFGQSFAEDGAYERFRAEAAGLLFKHSAQAGEEDLIDLRLSLARAEAESFVAELKDAIRIARERDRLPTPSEVMAYPIAAARAIPGHLRMAWAFFAEFTAYAAEVARAIRRSDTMVRGVGGLRRAREELPQRLVTGFERASMAARQSAGGLRQHYDFLVAAHDFQAKYEQLVRRAPEITERGRAFIARLDLADRSERLRLSSANFFIWLTRWLATGLAHMLAALLRLQSALRQTTPGALAAALLAPTPVRGRRLPAFRSYRMALAAGGLTEELEARPPAPAARGRTSRAALRSKAPPKHNTTIKTPIAARPARTKIAPASPRPLAPAAANEQSAPAAKPTMQAKAAPPPKEAAPIAHAIQQFPDAVTPAALPANKLAKATNGKRGAKAAAAPIAAQPPAPAAKPAIPAAPPPAAKETPQVAARQTPPPSKAEPAPAKTPPPAIVLPKRPASPASIADMPGPAPAAAATETQPALAAKPDHPSTPKRRPFLARLFRRSAPPPPEPSIADLLAEAWERQSAAAEETPSPPAAALPAETRARLLSKLADIPAEEPPAAGDDEEESDSRSAPAEEWESDAGEAESDGDPGPLTLSVMEVQAKLTPRPSQIRSFPWLRG